MLPLLATVLTGAVASFFFTKIIGHEATKTVVIIGAVISFPVGLTVNGMVTGHVFVSVPVAVGAILGPIAGYVAAAPFMLGM